MKIFTCSHFHRYSMSYSQGAALLISCLRPSTVSVRKRTSLFILPLAWLAWPDKGVDWFTSLMWHFTASWNQEILIVKPCVLLLSIFIWLSPTNWWTFFSPPCILVMLLYSVYDQQKNVFLHLFLDTIFLFLLMVFHFHSFCIKLL